MALVAQTGVLRVDSTCLTMACGAITESGQPYSKIPRGSNRRMPSAHADGNYRRYQWQPLVGTPILPHFLEPDLAWQQWQNISSQVTGASPVHDHDPTMPAKSDY